MPRSPLVSVRQQRPVQPPWMRSLVQLLHRASMLRELRAGRSHHGIKNAFPYLKRCRGSAGVRSAAGGKKGGATPDPPGHGAGIATSRYFASHHHPKTTGPARPSTVHTTADQAQRPPPSNRRHPTHIFYRGEGRHSPFVCCIFFLAGTKSRDAGEMNYPQAVLQGRDVPGPKVVL